MVKKKLFQGYMFYSLLLCVHLLHTAALDSYECSPDLPSQVDTVKESASELPTLSSSTPYEFDIDEEDGASLSPQEQSKAQKLLHAVLVKALNVYFLCQSSVNYLTSRTFAYYTACKNLLTSSK